MAKASDDAFVAKMLAEQHRIYRYVMTLVPNGADTEELVQQTLLVAWEKRDQYRDDHPFTAWACGIALNHVRNFRRKNRQQLFLGEAMLEQLGAVYLCELGRLDDRRQFLGDCLDQLSPENQSLLAEFYGNESSVKAIAGRLKRSVNAVYKTVHRLRAVLYDCVSGKLASEERR